MFPQNHRFYAPDPTGRSSVRGPMRDIAWDRPVFRPPVLPNPRVIYDPLPFTAQRLCAPSRATSAR